MLKQSADPNEGREKKVNLNERNHIMSSRENLKSSKVKNQKKYIVSRRGFLGGVVGGLSAVGLAGISACDDSKKQLDLPIWSGAKAPAERPQVPAIAKPNGLNMIVIIADTFRLDHLGCYGSERIKTPNLDKLAAQSIVFNSAHAEGLPTIPSRRVYHTGKSVLPYAEWQPLIANDITFAEVLSKHGVTTGFITDTYHYFMPDYNFHRWFDSWQWIRGQENDKYRSGLKDKFDPKKNMPAHLWNEKYDEILRQYLINTQDNDSEENYICMRSCKAGVQWVKENYGPKPFVLWLDLFDPHEPWDAPPRFQKMYRDKYPFERYLFGYGCRIKDIKPDDIPVLKDLYAAEVTYIDYCIGRFLDEIEKMGVMDNTIIVFSTDHGTHLGEEGCVQKTPSLLNRCLSHIPLIIRHPDKNFAGKRINGIVSALDYMPTFLELLGINDYKTMDGENMWQLVTGEKAALHDEVYTVFKDFGAIHNLEWHYFQRIKDQDSDQSIKQNDKHEQMMGSIYLYDLKKDPLQTKNVVTEYPTVAKQLREKMQNRLGLKIPELKI
jgi:arylsulfatase A-like enzyme